MSRCAPLVLFLACLVLGCEDPGTFGPGVVEGPDLKLVSLTIPKLSKGETWTITVTVRSNGTEPVPAPFSVKLIVATDSDHSQDFRGPFEWRREEIDGDLGPGEVLSFEAEIFLPLDDPASVGTPLYFYAVADAGQEADEALEDNNESTAAGEIAPPPSPDLQVDSCVSVGLLREGQDGTLTLTISNQGDLPAMAPFSARLTVRSDYSGAPLLASGTWTQETDLGAGASASFSLAVSIPADENVVRIRCAAMVDPDHVVDEWDDFNNTLLTTIDVLPPPRPDLIVEIDLPATSRCGNLLRWTHIVTNVGTKASGYCYGSFTYYIKHEGVERKGSTYSWRYSGTAPGESEAGDVAHGTSTLYPDDIVRIEALVDRDGQIEEENEGNNTDTAQTRMIPQL